MGWLVCLGWFEDLMFWHRELRLRAEDEYSSTLSCGDVGSFAAKFSTNTRERRE
jgi:hypothetical protein